MSIAQKLQEGSVQLLEAPGVIPVPGIPVFSRRPGDRANNLDTVIAEKILCVYVFPPLPTSAMRGSPVLFFDRYEVRVRIVEQIANNTHPVDAFDLMEVVASALHWTFPIAGLAHPMEISTNPVEAIEDAERRIIDVIFYAAIQLKSQTTL